MRRSPAGSGWYPAIGVMVTTFAVAGIRSCLPVAPESCRLEPQYEQRLRVSPVSSHARTKTTIGAAVKCPVK